MERRKNALFEELRLLDVTEELFLFCDNFWTSFLLLVNLIDHRMVDSLKPAEIRVEHTDEVGYWLLAVYDDIFSVQSVCDIK